MARRVRLSAHPHVSLVDALDGRRVLASVAAAAALLARLLVVLDEHRVADVVARAFEVEFFVVDAALWRRRLVVANGCGATDAAAAGAVGCRRLTTGRCG